MARLLTIGIPTYNRSKYLKATLECLSEHIIPFEKELEIIISDNYSIDSTSEIISEWADVQCNDLVVRHIRHSKNIGVSCNLVYLLYAATSDYFLFLGDDDKLNVENFSNIIKLLIEKQPSAVIQAKWEERIRSKKTGMLEFDEALELFYEYGNAWAGIVDRAAAVQAIESRLLRNEIETLVWPQTVFGFLAMFDQSPMRSIEAVDFEIGSPLAESLNITNKTYWIRSLTDLLKAATLIQRSTGNQSVGKYFLSFNSYGLIGHIKSIFWHTIVDSDQASLSEIRKLLRDEFGWRGWAWSSVLLFDKNPRLLRFSASIAYRFIRAESGISLESRLEEMRRRRETEILNKDKSGKRFGDWF